MSRFLKYKLKYYELVNSSHPIHLQAAEEKQNGFPFQIKLLETSKVNLWSASYSAGVVYTKTIIHLSVGESGGYLPCHGTQ